MRLRLILLTLLTTLVATMANAGTSLAEPVDWKIASWDSPYWNGGRCLDVRGGPGNSYNGTPVQVWDCNGGSHQRWIMQYAFYSEYWQATVYQIKSSDSGRCLDVRGGTGSIANGTPVQVWDCLGQSANQLWLRRYHEGRYQIIDYDSTLGDPKCLDIRGGPGNGPNGTPVQIYSCLGWSQVNQLWRF